MKNKIITIISILVVIIAGTFFFARENNHIKNNQTQMEASSEDSAKVLGASTVDQSDEQKRIFEKISAIKAKDLIAQSGDSLKIIDIRTSEEFLSGNIEKSTNIDFYGSFEEQISKLDRSSKYLIYCRSGNRSGQAIKIFEKLNFKEVYDLEGGYNAWITQ